MTLKHYNFVNVESIKTDGMLSGWSKEIFMHGNEDNTIVNQLQKKTVDKMKNISSSSTKIQPTFD